MGRDRSATAAAPTPLIDALREHRRRVASLRPLAPVAARTEELLRDLDEQALRARAAAVVCLVGPTGAGKSTLLNALAGRPIAREAAERPSTRTPVVYAPLDLDPAVLAALPAAEVVTYDPADAPWWSGNVLIDAPDVNSVEDSHRAIVRELVLAADVLLLVLHHQSVVEDATAAFVDAFKDRRAIAVVLNRIDEMTDATRDALLLQTREVAQRRWQVEAESVFALSALRARREGEGEPGFERLLRWLGRLVDEKVVVGVRRHNRAGTLRRIGTAYAEAAPAVEEGLAELETLVREGWAEMAARVAADVDRRAGARRADLEVLLAAELSKRWRGPGGWLLRIGLVGPAAAVGSLAIRRNPLVAGALAAGGHALGKLRAARAEGRIETADAVLPSGTDLEQWSEDTLQGARMLAERLGCVGVGTTLSPAAVSELLGGVADAWSAVLAVDLAERADGVALRLVRLPLDLPLYLLAGHVGWQSAVHYVGGSYLGVDYYVNAAVFAALVGAAVYLLSRGLVGLAARRMLRQVRRRLDEAVGCAAARIGERQAGEVAALRSSLAALTRAGSDPSD